MKILIATGIYPPEIGGPATYSKLLKDKLPLEGVEVEVLPFRVVRNVPKIFRHLMYFFKVLKKSKNVDIVYAQDTISVGFPVAVAMYIRKKPFVVKIVGDHAWEQGVQRFGVTDMLDKFSVSHGYSVIVEIFKKIETFVAQRSSAVVVPSEYLKKIVMNWGIEGSKIKIVYNAFKQSGKELSEKDELRRKYKFDGYTIISAGRFAPWKGFETLVEVFSKIHKINLHTKLIIVGDGNQMNNIKSCVEKYNLSDSVVLPGRLDRLVLLEQIKAADLFVLNTAYEGLSHQLLEVMSLNVPIITTSVGGNVELIEHNDNGLLVEYDDKNALKNEIERMMSGDVDGVLLSNNAYKKVKYFTEKRMIDGVVEILKLVGLKNKI